jgi:hypothetical protein
MPVKISLIFFVKFEATNGVGGVVCLKYCKARCLKRGRRIHPDQVLVLYHENRDGLVFRIAHPPETLRSRIRSPIFGNNGITQPDSSERTGGRAEGPSATRENIGRENGVEFRLRKALRGSSYSSW